MRIEEVEKRIKEMQCYLDLYKAYDDNKELEKRAFKLYAEVKKLIEVRELLNEEGYRYEAEIKTPDGLRKLKNEDVTDILLDPNPNDEFQKIVSKIFKQSRNKALKIW